MKKQKDNKHLAAHYLLVLCTFALVLTSVKISWGADKSDELSADFVMTRTISALNDSIKSTGRIYLGGPGLLRWEMLKPARSVLVVNGETAWLHYPDMGVTKGFSLSSDPVMSVLSKHLLALTKGNFKNLAQYYDVSDAVKETRTLTPKQDTVKKIFKALKVKANSNGIVSFVEMISQSGDVTKIEFSNVNSKAALSPSLFKKPKQNKR